MNKHKSLEGEKKVMREYKKSYTGFIIWLILFCVCCIGVCFIPKTNTKFEIAMVGNIMIIGCFVLSLIIYLTEYVYWYNGTSYEDAKAAGSERRKKFALEHMKRFGLFALGFMVYTIISFVLKISFGIDITIAGIGIVAVSLSTIKIKL